MADSAANPQPPVAGAYGNLGPGSDLASDNRPVQPSSGGPRVLFAIAAGAILAIPFVVAEKTVHASWEQISQILGMRGKPEPASPAILSDHEIADLDHKTPQHQAQLLLQRAVNHYDGATDQIESRLGGWRDKLELSSQLNTLITTALNSDDLRVRVAGIEVDLVAVKVEKNSDAAEHLISQAQFGAENERVWALWTLGLLGNRGIEPDRITEILTAQLRDPNPNVRHWAVEGLSYLGTDETTIPLLRTLHDDPSSMVRERAACALAQSGMLTQEQRRKVVPKLIEFAEDESLDPQTHSWVYHALRDITAQNLPDEPSAWRNWYGAAGQS